MFAVFKTGGKQYRVAAEDVLKVDKIKGEPGEIVEFGEVLVVGGDSVTLGAPTVAGATVAAEVLDQARGAENHRLQKAPAEELAPQARSSAGIHPAADHRNPDRRKEAEQDGAADGRSGRRRRTAAEQSPTLRQRQARRGSHRKAAKLGQGERRAKSGAEGEAGGVRQSAGSPTIKKEVTGW